MTLDISAALRRMLALTCRGTRRNDVGRAWGYRMQSRRFRVAASSALVAVLLAGMLPGIALAADPEPTSVTLAPYGWSGPLEEHTAVQLWVGVGTMSGNAGWDADATLTVAETGVGTPWCVMPALASNETWCTIPSLAPGSHVFTATYSGNALFAPSTSDALSVDIVPDTVHATGVTIGYSAFYPYKDGYRDTLSIKGTRNEPITTSIRIYNGTGTRVKTFTLDRATGSYTVIWTGRNSAGRMLARGRYRVVQRLVDDFGTAKTVTSYVTLSHKRLYWSTTHITKLGSSYSSRGTSGDATVTKSTTFGYAKIKAPGAYWRNWASVGYQFTLPSAVAYKGLSFQVYHSGTWWSGPNHVGLQNFSTCPLTSGDWDESCFDTVGSVGTDTAGVKKWSDDGHGSATANRSGRTVRGMVSVVAGTYYVYKARVKITYAVLK